VPNCSSRREASQKVLCARSRHSFSGHSVVHGRGLTLQRGPSGNPRLPTLERSNTTVGAAILGLLTHSHEEVNAAAIRERLRICHRASPSRRMCRHAVEHRFRRQDSTAGPGRLPAQHSVATLPLSFALRNAEVIQLGANIPPPARHSEIFGKHMKGLIFLGTTAFVI
jgi:hypothetical protein